MKVLLEKVEAEIRELETEATEVQRNAKVYVPDEDDAVDKAVANALNEFGRPIEVGLVRLANGIYLCGENKVNVSFVSSKLMVKDGEKQYDFADYLKQFH